MAIMYNRFYIGGLCVLYLTSRGNEVPKLDYRFDFLLRGM